MIKDVVPAQVLVDSLQQSKEQDAADWLAALPRAERRKLFRKHGILKGARRKGGGLR